MSKNLTYTTGQVSGITDLANMTLYRYVKLFGEFFSQGVTQHTRGRHWSEDDIMLAMSIRSLFDRRAGEEAIRETLRKGWRLDTQPMNSPEVQQALSSLFEVCQVYREQAEKDRTAAHNLTLSLGQLYKHAHDDHALLINLQNALLSQATEINTLNTSRKAFINFRR
jgi:hypothetical protein